MKWKLYLRTCAAALAAVAVAAGCSDSDDPDQPIPPPTGEKYAFSIAVSDIKGTSASVTVTPDDKSTQATWYCSMIAKQSFDASASDAAFLQNDLAYLKEEAAKAGVSLSAYLATKIESGTKTVPFTGLTASTDYYAYVYGITEAGEITSPLFKQFFSTPAGPEPETLTFEFSVTNITKTAADIDVIPSNDNDTYYFDVSPVKAFEGMTDEEVLAEVIDGLTADDLTQGPDGLPAELIEYYAPFTPGTDYYVYAVGFDVDKGATTQLFKYKFTTEAPTGTAPELTVTVAPGDANGANKATNLTFTSYAPDAVSGLYVMAPKSQVDALVAKGATLDELITVNGKPFSEERMALLTVEPGLPITFVNLTPETDYTFLIKVTGEGGMSTVERKDGATQAASTQPSDMTFEFSVTDVTATEASIVITPSKTDETYFFDIQEKAVIDSFEGNLAELIAAFNEAYAQYGGIGGMLSTGVESYPANKLTPNTSYYVVAFGYSDGVATTELMTYEFKTESAATSDLTFEITVDETQPVPGGVTATITPSNEEEDYLFAFTLADEIDALKSDAEIIAYYEEMYGGIIQWLTITGVYETMPTDFGGDLAMIPGADYYIVAFGYGESGATTDVTKMRIKAGAGPDPVGTTFSFAVSELTATSATVTVTASKEPVIYMWDIMSEADFTELGGTTDGIKAYVAEQFEYYSEVFTPRQVIAGLGAWYTGASYDYNESLAPSTTYVPFAACVDVDGKVVDTPVIGERFTTEAAAGGASVPKFFGRYEVGDLTPRIYRPMDGAAARQRIEALLRHRSARAAASVPQAIVRGAGLRAAVHVEAIEAEAVQLVAPAPGAASPRQALAQLPRRSKVRTPRP